MDTEALAKLIKEDNEQTRRHFDVVAESLKSEIRVIAEGHGVLVDKIDGLGTRMDSLETKVDRLDTRMDGLDTRMDHLETKVDSLETKVDHLDARMDGLDTRMDHLETKVDRLETKVDGLDHKLDNFIVETRTNFEEVRASIKFSYAELDRRLTFLESGFKDLSSRMASLEGRQAH